MLSTNIIKILDDTTIYPSTPAYKCDMLDSDNKHYEASISVNEVNLVLYLKNLKYKLNSTEINRLISLIEEYGQEKYSEGCDNANSEHLDNI